MYFPALPYDIAAIEGWRSEIRRLAKKVNIATAAAGRVTGPKIEFEGPAADRYTEHLSAQLAQMRAAEQALSAVSARVDGVIAEAARINREHVAAVEAAAEAQRRLAGTQ